MMYFTTLQGGRVIRFEWNSGTQMADLNVKIGYKVFTGRKAVKLALEVLPREEWPPFTEAILSRYDNRNANPSERLF